jgi:hypothetical protein
MAIDRHTPDLEKLWQKALKMMKEKGRAAEQELKMNESDIYKMSHELEVYKVELEIVEDELRHADSRIDEISRKYDELSDLHNRFILQMVKERRKPF